MRIFSAALLLLLVACGGKPAVENKVAAVPEADRIECALDGAAAFAKDCALERGGGSALTLRHSDGGFRKLTLDKDGLIDTADGADAIILAPISDGRTEISVGGDRYRLPAGI